MKLRDLLRHLEKPRLRISARGRQPHHLGQSARAEILRYPTSPRDNRIHRAEDLQGLGHSEAMMSALRFTVCKIPSCSSWLNRSAIRIRQSEVRISLMAGNRKKLGRASKKEDHD
jgi:hypothetical protein